jgi:hypothetical protein
VIFVYFFSYISGTFRYVWFSVRSSQRLTISFFGRFIQNLPLFLRLVCSYFLRSRLHWTSLCCRLRSRIRRKATCATKATSTTNALSKCLHHLHFGIIDALEDYFYGAAIIGVDYACAGIDAVLCSEAGAGSDTAVCSWLSVLLEENEAREKLTCSFWYGN